MKKKHFLTLAFVVFTALTAFAGGGKSGGVDWFNLIITVGYLGGVFVFLPIVFYTNLNEKVTDVPSDAGLKENVQGITPEERNQKTAKILQTIENKLTTVNDEDGNEMITITNGSQARFMKKGLDYILIYLKPTDQSLIDIIENFRTLYQERTKRIFTGSKWVLGCAIGVGLIFLLAGGIYNFVIIHTLGTVFYFLSSRTPVYGLEKRLKWIGGINSGIVASVFAGLFSSFNTKHYNVYSDGSKERDYESEMADGYFLIILTFVAAMILGFFAAVLGVINFLLNYSTSFILPIKKQEKWYEENFDIKIATDVP